MIDKAIMIEEESLAGTISSDGSLTGTIVTDGVFKGSALIPNEIKTGVDTLAITITGDITSPISDATYREVKYAVDKNSFIIVNVFGIPYSVSGREVLDNGTVRLEILSGYADNNLLMDCYNLFYTQSGSITMKTNTYDFGAITSGTVLGSVDSDGNVVIMLNDKLFSSE